MGEDVKKGDISEVRAMARPPTACILPIKAVAILLDYELDEANEWKSCQEVLGDVGLLSKIGELKVDKESISAEKIAKGKELTSHERFTYPKMARCSLFCAVL